MSLVLASSQYASRRPTLSRFSVVFLGPGATAELVRKFHVASHGTLPILTSKFRPKVAPSHVNTKISRNAALPRLMSKFRTPIECSKTLLSFSHCSTSHLSTFSTSERLTFSSIYLYQKDKWALLGNLHR
jgi:hypothetical protein